MFRQPDDEFDGWLKRIWKNSNWVFSKLAPINGRIRFKISFSTILVSSGKKLINLYDLGESEKLFSLGIITRDLVFLRQYKHTYIRIPWAREWNNNV